MGTMPTNRIRPYLTNPPAPTEFVGWVRSGDSDWQERCSASTSAGCWGLLLSVEATGRVLDRTVMPAGKHPSGSKARR